MPPCIFPPCAYIYYGSGSPSDELLSYTGNPSRFSEGTNVGLLFVGAGPFTRISKESSDLKLKRFLGSSSVSTCNYSSRSG
jgi:hypothetical protein